MTLKHPHYKGNKFERDMSKRLSKDFGADVIRTPGSGAFGTRVKLSDFQGDLYCKTKSSILKTFFFECKHVENATFTNLHTWYNKCEVQNNNKQTVIFIRDNVHDFILTAMNPECFYRWISFQKMQTKIGYKHIEKEKANFWKEYNKVSYIKKIPVIVLNKIVILEYIHWSYIIRRNL